MSRLGDSLMALTLDILTSGVGIGTKFALRLLFHILESNCHGGQTADRIESITIH